MMTTLTARPEAITFDPQQSALIVVDMQNAYATPGSWRSRRVLLRLNHSPGHCQHSNRRDRSASGRDADQSGFKMAGMNSMSKLADPAHRIFINRTPLKP